MARVYKRDARGRFAGGGGSSGGSKKAKSLKLPARKPLSQGGSQRGGGLLVQRAAVRSAKAKLAAKDTADQSLQGSMSRRAQKGAVTRAQNALKAAEQRGRVRLGGQAGVIRPGKGKGKGGSRKASDVVKPPPSRSDRAKAIKRMVERQGTVPGSRFEGGKSVSTMSLKEMRTAVRQHARKAGITSKSDFELFYAMAAGVTKKGAKGAAVGRQPRTRSDWERIYKDTIGVPQSERNRKAGPGIFRGIDIHTNSRARYVFDLKPGAGRAEINQAYRQLAKRAHPDLGGRAKDLARLTQMRNSLLAQLPEPKPSSKGGSRKASGGSRKASGSSSAKPAAASATPRGGAIVRSPGGAIVPTSRAKPAARPAPAASTAPRVPASQRPGSITSTLRGTMQALAQSDAQRIREIEAITGKPVRASRAGGTAAGNRVRGTAQGKSVSGTMRSAMRELAQSDARFYRELGSITGPSKPRQVKGSSGKGSLPAAPKKPRKRKAS